MDSNDWILLVAGAVIGGFAVYFLSNLNKFPNNSVNASTATNVIAENAETIEWKDYKGNSRQITVHREVRA